MFYCTLFCSVLSLHNSSVRHELEEQIVHEDKGYPLKMVKRKIVVLCYFKSHKNVIPWKVTICTHRLLVIYLSIKYFYQAQDFQVTTIFGKSRDQNRKQPKTKVAYTSGKWCQWLTIAKVQNSTYQFFEIRVTVRFMMS